MTHQDSHILTTSHSPTNLGLGVQTLQIHLVPPYCKYAPPPLNFVSFCHQLFLVPEWNSGDVCENLTSHSHEIPRETTIFSPLFGKHLISFLFELSGIRERQQPALGRRGQRSSSQVLILYSYEHFNGKNSTRLCKYRLQGSWDKKPICGKGIGQDPQNDVLSFP